MPAIGELKKNRFLYYSEMESQLDGYFVHNTQGFFILTLIGNQNPINTTLLQLNIVSYIILKGNHKKVTVFFILTLKRESQLFKPLIVQHWNCFLYYSERESKPWS